VRRIVVDILSGAKTKMSEQGILPQSKADEIREKARLRKQRQRIRNTESAADKELDAIEKFWETNRSKVDSTRIAQLEERQKQVFSLVNQMEKIQSEPNPETVQTIIAKVREDVRLHGLVNTSVDHQEFWESKLRFEQIVSRGGATAIFVEFGIFTAIHHWRYDQWNKWLDSESFSRLPIPSRPTKQTIEVAPEPMAGPEESLLEPLLLDDWGRVPDDAARDLLAEGNEEHLRLMAQGSVDEQSS
jgi:hypothetical protein